MDQKKIGRFIAGCRKDKGLTQMQLAEMLNITDRAVSKWENGKAMPDSSIMLELCDILGITVNDLLSGEVIDMDKYNVELEKNLLEMIRQKEQTDRRMLTIEIVLGIVALLPIIAFLVAEKHIPMKEEVSTVIGILSVIPILVATPFAIRIEQTAGYYECRACGNRYIPEYKSVFAACHAGWTRYMRCPECKKITWQKKVIEKDKKRTE